MTLGIKITAGTTTDLLTLGPTSKAARVTPYDALGTNRGVAYTYRLATDVATNAGLVVAPNSTSWFAQFRGNVVGADGRVRAELQRVVLSGFQSSSATLVYVPFILERSSALPTGGSQTSYGSAIPVDSTSPAGRGLLTTYPAGSPTAPPNATTIATKSALVQANTAAAGGWPAEIDFDLRNLQSENSPARITITEVSSAITTTECIGMRMGVLPGVTVTMSIMIEWIEYSF